MIKLSIAIARSGQKVIVRPHPSENIDVWKKKTQDYSKNIKIVRSGSIVPWLMAAKVVVHNGCNTAIEGLMLDRIIISYRPYKNSEVETYLPNAISTNLETEDEVIKYLRNLDINSSKFQKKEKLEILKKYVKINNLQEDASLRILDLIENLFPQKKNTKLQSIKYNICIELSQLKSMIGREIYKKNFSYLKKKCPSLDLNQVNKILDFFSEKKDKNLKLETSKLTKHSVVISKI